MQALYELGRMASGQSLLTALPDPDGLRILLRGGYVFRRPDNHYELSPKGLALATRLRALMLQTSTINQQPSTSC